MLAVLLVGLVAYLIISRDRAHSSARRAREELDAATAPPPVEPGD
jgi:hypothetical protein